MINFPSKPGELVGFHAPASLLAKMRCFMGCVRTDPAASDDELLRRSRGQIAAWEAERRRFTGLAGSAGGFPDSMMRVGQSEWDDIKILRHQMGHLISKFQAIWDTTYF